MSAFGLVLKPLTLPTDPIIFSFINGKMLSLTHEMFHKFALASPGEVIWSKSTWG